MNDNPAPLYPVGALIDGLAEDAARRREAIQAGRQLGAITKLPTIDRTLGGYLAPGIHTIHGGPGIGKSALGVQIACDSGVPAVFASCELGPHELLRRLIARQTCTYLGRLKNGEFSGDAVRDLARKTAEALPLLGIMDCTTASAPITRLSEALAATKEAPGIEAARGPGALLVLDSLHTWAARNLEGLEEYERLGRALSSLEQLAQVHGVPVLIIAERNRASMKDGGQHSAAGSRRVEYSGESVLGLDSDGEEDMQGWRPVKVHISKNRHGAPGGTVKMDWHGAMQTFRERGEG